MMATKLLGLGIAAIAASALLLPVGSGVAFAQVVASATGSGQIHVSGDLRTFTFNAQTDSLGVTTGQTEGKNRNAGTHTTGSEKRSAAIAGSSFPTTSRETRSAPPYLRVIAAFADQAIRYK